MHQHISKLKNRTAKTAYVPIFLPFCVIIISFVFFLSKCNYNRIKLCYNRLQFLKVTQISTVSNTEQRAKLYKDFLNILLGANCTKTWGQTSKSHWARSLAGACIVRFYDYEIKNLQSFLNTPWQYILLIYFYLFTESSLSLSHSVFQSFYYILSVYIFLYKLFAGSNLELNLPEKMYNFQ